MNGDATERWPRMTKEEWLACDDPGKMLGVLHGKANQRKIRLFACACCWRIRSVLPDRGAVEIAEGHADGEETDRALRSVWQDIRWCAHGLDENSPEWLAAQAVLTLTNPDLLDHPFEMAERVSDLTLLAEQRIQAASNRLVEKWLASPVPANDGVSWRCDILRDLIDDCTFAAGRQLPMSLDARCLALRMAQQMYDAGKFDELPILADALEDDGYTDEQVLAHLRKPAPHVRGCWALDALLRKSDSG